MLMHITIGLQEYKGKLTEMKGEIKPQFCVEISILLNW